MLDVPTVLINPVYYTHLYFSLLTDIALLLSGQHIIVILFFILLGEEVHIISLGNKLMLHQYIIFISVF